MLKKRGGLHRYLIIVGSAGGSVSDLVRGLWHSDSGRRWLVPLAIFLCIIGMIFAMAASVEALAPFVYSIF